MIDGVTIGGGYGCAGLGHVDGAHPLDHQLVLSIGYLSYEN
ncbi:hypothetical protein [Rhodococcus wratislaviensis]